MYHSILYCLRLKKKLFKWNTLKFRLYWAKGYALYTVYTPPHGRRKAGRPRTQYLTYIQRLMGDNDGMLQEKRSLLTNIFAMGASQKPYNLACRVTEDHQGSPSS